VIVLTKDVPYISLIINTLPAAVETCGSRNIFDTVETFIGISVAVVDKTAAIAPLFSMVAT
jgi:hypothetical protein